MLCAEVLVARTRLEQFSGHCSRRSESEIIAGLAEHCVYLRGYYGAYGSELESDVKHLDRR
jgi:hypothetical protein